MTFGHYQLVVENFRQKTFLFGKRKPAHPLATPISKKARRYYFVASPPNVTLIPLRKLNGNAGKPGAGS